MRCAACGGTALVKGTIMGNDGSSLGFYPSDTPTLKRIFALGSRSVRAYGCIRCQNLQLAVEFSESDLERYQQFEGEQPGVLERINSKAKGLES